MSPQAVRVRTSSGWQDIALTGPPGPAGGAMQLISDQLLTANGTFDFLNIPQTYDHLRLVALLRSTLAAQFDVGRMMLNGDTGNNYSTQRLRGNGSVTLTVENIGIGYVQLDVPGASVAANCFASVILDIPHYRGGHLKQLTGIDDVLIAAPTVASGLMLQRIFSVWNNVAAINRISLTTTTYAPGSRVSLYGISSSGPQTGIPFVTTLPASPINGQEVYYQVDATAGVVWHLRYNAASASAYKWEYLGGPPLRGFYAPAENFPTGWGSGSPAVTVPRSGDYDVEWLLAINGSGVSQFYMAPYIDTTRIDAVTAAAFMTANPQEMTVEAKNRLTIAAGQVLRQGFVQSGAQGTAKNRTLLCTPVRII